MRIRIVSDGTAFGTQLVDADTGANISEGMRCTRVVIDARDGLATATLTVDAVTLDLTTEFTQIERDATLTYDLDDIDSIDQAIAALQEQRAARLAT